MLNVEKLFKSDFVDRFLGLVEVYDALLYKNVFIHAKKWVDCGRVESDCIKFFLMPSDSESALPFEVLDYRFMTPNEITKEQERRSKIHALLEQKTALYKEFLTFFE